MKKLLSLLTLFIFIDNIQAQTSEQTIYRAEFMFCNFNEGKLIKMFLQARDI